MNQQNKPQDNAPKSEYDVSRRFDTKLNAYEGGRNDCKKEYESRIAELEAELRSIKDTIEKDPVSFILVHALKYLNNDDKIVLLEKLGGRTNLTELEKQNADLINAGQKLEGILTNIRYETDYMSEFYYDWIDQVLNETDDLFSDEEPIT